MQIGFIEDTPLHGGTQIWVTEANRAFIARGNKTMVIAPAGSWVARECAKDGAETAGYDFDKVTSEDSSVRRVWADALANCDVAVCTVHPPRNGFHCSVFAARCIKEFRLNTILIPKSGTIVPEYKREFYLPDETINSSVIAITEFTRRYLVSDYKIPEEGTALVYQGTDLETFKPDPRRSKTALDLYPLPANAAPIIGCVGSYEHRKGQVVLLEAVKMLVNSSMPDLHLIMVGDGPDEEMLKQKVIDMQLQENVTFFPFTRQPEYIFERIDILVLSSLYKEGLPNVLLEALAMGVPVVSSDLAGVPEIVIDGETGYKVEPGKPDQIAARVSKLWQDKPALEKMGERGRRFIHANFDKNTQFDKFLEHFRVLAGRFNLKTD